MTDTVVNDVHPKRAFTLDHWAPYLDETARRTIESFVRDCEAGVKREKALFLYGIGGNGKSVLINEICTFLGEGCQYILSRPSQDMVPPAQLYIVSTWNDRLHDDPDGTKWISSFLKLKEARYREMYQTFIPGNVLVHSNVLPRSNQDSFQVVEFRHVFKSAPVSPYPNVTGVSSDDASVDNGEDCEDADQNELVHVLDVNGQTVEVLYYFNQSMQRGAVTGIIINTPAVSVYVSDVAGFSVDSEQGSVSLSQEVMDVVNEFAKEHNLDLGDEDLAQKLGEMWQEYAQEH